MKRLYMTVLALWALGFGSVADAASIRWTLNDFDFGGGGEATGSFDWDTDTNMITAFNISVTATTSGNPRFTDFTYSDVAGDTAAVRDAALAGDEDYLAFVTTRDPFILGPSFNPPLLDREFRIGFGTLFPFDTLDTPVAKLDLPATGQFTINGFAECFNCSPARFGLPQSQGADPFLSAGVVTAPVPLPASALLLLGGIAGFGVLRRVRKRPS